MYLFGASGHAKVIIEILRLNKVPILGLFDDDPLKKELMGLPVIGNIDDYKQDGVKSIISIGDNTIRKRVTTRIVSKYGRAIHPASVISKAASVDEGTAVMAGSVINIDAVAGRHCIINTGAVVDHDCVLEDFVHVAPNATLCGGVTVGEGTLIGAGSVVTPNIHIGKWSIVAAGAVVIRDVPDSVMVAGNPAKIIKYL